MLEKEAGAALFYFVTDQQSDSRETQIQTNDRLVAINGVWLNQKATLPGLVKAVQILSKSNKAMRHVCLHIYRQKFNRDLALANLACIKGPNIDEENVAVKSPAADPVTVSSPLVEQVTTPDSPLVEQKTAPDSPLVEQKNRTRLAIGGASNCTTTGGVLAGRPRANETTSEESAELCPRL